MEPGVALAIMFDWEPTGLPMDRDRKEEEEEEAGAGDTDICDQREVLNAESSPTDDCTDWVLVTKLSVAVGSMTGGCKVDVFWRGTPDHAGDTTNVEETVVNAEGAHTLCISLDSKPWVKTGSSMTLTGTQ